MRAAPLLAIPLVVAALAPAPPALQEDAAPVPDARVLRRSWNRLRAEERREVTQWYALECRSLDTLRARAVRRLVAAEPSDPGLFPEAVPAPPFEAADHLTGARAARSDRRLLDPEGAAVAKLRRRLHGRQRDAPRPPAFRYRWSTGALERAGDPEDPERLFEDALAGRVPGSDLALALLLRALDGGAERAGFAAFDHAYADNRGKVYVGVTLYEAFASGERVDLPDTDSLGLARGLFADTSRWSAPLGAAERKTLYAAISDELLHLKRYRELREALARALLGDAEAVAEGYEEVLPALLGHWLRADLDAGRLAAELPDRAGWADYFEAAGGALASDPELRAAVLERSQRLEAERGATRAVLGRVLDAFLAAPR